MGRRHIPAVLFTVLAFAGPVLANGPDWRRSGTSMWVGAYTARACNGALTVTYGRQILVGHEWRITDRDDSQWIIEVHDYSGRFQNPNNPASDGKWLPTDLYGAGPVVSGGEHALRWPGYGRALGNGAHIDKARVVRADGTGLTSVPAAIDWCPPPLAQ